MGARQNNSRPSFFKVMIGDFKKKLKIPVNFIGNFNGVIPYDSVLRSPSGCWNVKVREEEDGGLYFRKGWPDFVQANYLGHEDFVTMKYIGDSQFAVKLYGKNGCENVLPSRGSNNGVNSIPSRKRKEYGQTSRGKFTSYGTNFDQHKYRAGYIGRDSFCSDKRNCGLFKCDELKRKTTVIEGRTRADQAECSRKGNPHFITIWTAKKKYQMEIPEKVVRKIGRTLSDIVAMKSTNGRLWDVELKRSEGKVWFYKGWKEFTEHNFLRDGHVLGISYNGNSQFCVRIIDAMEPLDDPGNQGESNPKKMCRLSKREEKEEDDCAILLDAPPSRTHVKSNTNEERAQLSVPPGLDIRSPRLGNERTPSGECLPAVKQEESEDSSDSPDASKLFHKVSRITEDNERVTEITMQLNKNNGTKSLVSDETRSPCLGNERTPSGERLPSVKQEESEDTSDLPDASKLFHKVSRRTEGNERVAEITKSFESQTPYPFFAVCMRDSYLTYGYLHIPNSFAKKHLPKNTQNIMVRDLEDKLWTVGYSIKGYAANLTGGWPFLRRALSLTEGDVCVFELLKEKEIEMRVSVFREIENVLTKI